MHPTLFHLGQTAIHTYGIAMALGFIVAVLLGVRAARRQGIGADRLLDLAFWIIVSALLGSRLLFVITEAPAYLHLCLQGQGGQRRLGQVLWDCSSALHLWEGGLVFYGGLLGAVLASIWYCRRAKLSFLRVADLLVPLIALGHFFGRLGCLSAGCCYGRVSSGIGLRFPPVSVAYQEMVRDGLLPGGAPCTPALYPTQLGEAGVELGLFFLLTILTPRKRYHGQLLWLYLLLYPLARFFLELFRADPDRHYVVALNVPWLSSLLGLPPGLPPFLSTSQLVSLGLIAVALLGIWRQRRASAAARPRQRAD